MGTNAQKSVQQCSKAVLDFCLFWSKQQQGEIDWGLLCRII